MQYQVSSSTDSSTPKQNGEAPAVKTTTIHIPSSTPILSTNSNNNHNSSAAETARSRGLPDSVVKFLTDMPEPVRPPTEPATVHTGQDAMEWKRRRAWREEREKELEKDVNRVHSLISDVAADTQDKPSSDTL